MGNRLKSVEEMLLMQVYVCTTGLTVLVEKCFVVASCCSLTHSCAPNNNNKNDASTAVDRGIKRQFLSPHIRPVRIQCVVIGGHWRRL